MTPDNLARAKLLEPVPGERVSLVVIGFLIALGALFTEATLERAWTQGPEPSPTVSAQAHASSTPTPAPSPTLAPTSTPSPTAPPPPAQTQTPAPEASPSATVQPSDCPPVFTVYYESGQSTPPLSAREQAHSLADWMKRHPEAWLIVSGHTDTTGSQKLNEAISRERAENLVEIFTDEGVELPRIAIRFASAHEASSSSDERHDRRVTLAILGGPPCADNPEKGVEP